MLLKLTVFKRIMSRSIGRDIPILFIHTFQDNYLVFTSPAQTFDGGWLPNTYGDLSKDTTEKPSVILFGELQAAISDAELFTEAADFLLDSLLIPFNKLLRGHLIQRG